MPWRHQLNTFWACLTLGVRYIRPVDHHPKGNETNSYQGQPYSVVPSADDTMSIDPGHEFPDVVEQLCGENAAYPLGGPYPPIDNSGFVADYAKSPSASQREGNAPSNFGEIMNEVLLARTTPRSERIGKGFRGL